MCSYKITVARCSIPLTYNKFYINDSSNEDDDNHNKSSNNNNNEKDNKKNKNDNDNNDDENSLGLVEVFRICYGEENGDISIGINIIIITIIVT